MNAEATIDDKSLYEFERENTPFIARLDGLEIHGIAKVKSTWSSYTPGVGSTFPFGVLVREGTITIINPDHQNSAVIAASIFFDETVYYRLGRHEIDQAAVRVYLIPKDKASLELGGDAEEKGSFKDLVQNAFPNRPDGVGGANIPHMGYVAKKTGVDLFRVQGLCICTNYNRRVDPKNKNPFSGVFDADIISPDAKTRDVMHALLNKMVMAFQYAGIANPNKAALPAGESMGDKIAIRF